MKHQVTPLLEGHIIWMLWFMAVKANQCFGSKVLMVEKCNKGKDDCSESVHIRAVFLKSFLLVYLIKNTIKTVILWNC